MQAEQKNSNCELESLAMCDMVSRLMEIFEECSRTNSIFV
jgi:hypothetical protein